MDAFARLLERHPLVFVHLVTALAALLLGAALLALPRKGNAAHRTLGWAWVGAMAATTLASAFIRDYRMPNIAGITPIHAFTLLTAVGLPRGVWLARRGDLQGHRRQMRGLYIGACLVAGLFALLPGRFLGTQLWAALGAS
jgi:uncharacterized membrane protein